MNYLSTSEWNKTHNEEGRVERGRRASRDEGGEDIRKEGLTATWGADPVMNEVLGTLMR